jgi:hypothetical protein
MVGIHDFFHITVRLGLGVTTATSLPSTHAEQEYYEPRKADRSNQLPPRSFAT